MKQAIKNNKLGNLYTLKEKYFKKIKIGAKFYKIYICRGLKFNNLNYNGFVDYDDKRIYLRRRKDIEQTLIHELTHTFMHELYRVKNMKNKKMIKTLRGYERFIEDLRYLIMQNFKLKNEIF